MRKTEIYKKIKTIANQLVNDGKTWPRVDLAFELKESGATDGDSLDVGRLVIEAYQHYNNAPDIYNAFTNNEGTRSLVEDVQITNVMEDNPDEAFELVDTELRKGGKSLSELSKSVTRILKDRVQEKHLGPALLSLATLQGTRGVESVRAHAQNYFEAYQDIVSCYGAAKDDVKKVMADFIEIRSYVKEIYTDYVCRLENIYGDAIKSVAPNLFDFGSVQFLDVEELLRTVKLEYDRLDEHCRILIGDISQKFTSNLTSAAKGASQIYRTTESKAAAAAEVGVSLLEHYLDTAGEKTILENELEEMKQCIRHDVTLIKGDHTRLASIYKILNDLYIPKSNVFYKFSGEVLNSELRQLMDTLYAEKDVSDLVRQKNDLLKKVRHVEGDASDHQMNIVYYTDSISQAKTIIESKFADYQYALKSKPSSPFFLFNWLTLGGLKRRYSRKIYEWKHHQEPIINEYNEYKISLSLDQKELEFHKRELKNDEKQLAAIKKDLDILNRRISAKIIVSDEIKSKMAEHLENILKLLHIAKEIIESRLDEKHINTVQIVDLGKIELSEEVEENLNSFIESLKNPVADASVEAFTEMVGYKTGQENPDGEDAGDSPSTVSEEQTENVRRVAQKGLDLVKQCSRLAMIRRQGELSGAEYARQLKAVQEEFRTAMAQTDKKSEALMQTLRKINTAKNSDELKDALMLLGEGTVRLTHEDLEQILKGTKKN